MNNLEKLENCKNCGKPPVLDCSCYHCTDCDKLRNDNFLIYSWNEKQGKYDDSAFMQLSPLIILLVMFILGLWWAKLCTI